MRDLIDLIEAKTVAPNMSTQIAMLGEKAEQVARALAKVDPDLAKWDRAWVDQVRMLFEADKHRHDVSQQEEVAEDSKYQPVPYNIKDATPEILGSWWHNLDKIDLPAAVKSEWTNYLDDHPKTESSDEMDLLRTEKKLADAVYFGGFDDLHTMDAVLTAIQNYVDDAARVHVSTRFSQQLCTPETAEFITKAIPLVIFYVKLMSQ